MPYRQPGRTAVCKIVVYTVNLLYCNIYCLFQKQNLRLSSILFTISVVKAACPQQDAIQA
ncbi:hypothetical protein CR205_05680 [Alteribacter lacisalsi]|uniref:Uncharacterized protein n=1 Tax=Alteribacter lacisalsi TaxID=2045244 RepID=A0A2W0HAB2_9BACI|nr:hypothetical protein CR205_05680 [Alteribacter lacisalsi]